MFMFTMGLQQLCQQPDKIQLSALLCCSTQSKTGKIASFKAKLVHKISVKLKLKLPGPASTVVNRSLRKSSSKGTAVRSPLKEASFQAASF